MTRKADWTLMLVTDRAMAGGRPLTEVVAAAVRGGVTAVQIREKEAATQEFLEQAQALKALLAPLGIPLIVNDRVDIALAIEADGVHVGQDDMPAPVARSLIGPERWLGLSVTKPEEIRADDVTASDYLGVGPIHPTTTKPTQWVTTPEDWAAIRLTADRPLIAIGGMTAGTLDGAVRAGAAGIAVVSAIMAAPDPEGAARMIRQAIERARQDGEA